MMSDKLNDIKVCVNTIAEDEKMSELSAILTGTLSIGSAVISALLVKNAMRLRNTEPEKKIGFRRENGYE